MGIFDFLKRKKKKITNQKEPTRQIKQGIHREREFFPKTRDWDFEKKS